MNIFKSYLIWATIAVIGALVTFGPLLLTMVGLIDSDVARSITLYIGSPIFIPSAIGMKIAQRFSSPKN
jgi:hypothetical protein